jgi:hypothetical protein
MSIQPSNRDISAIFVACAFATACGGAQREPMSELRVAEYRSVEDVQRELARIAGADDCSFFWGESPWLYWEVQRVTLRWGAGERLRGFLLCGEARDAALRDPRIDQDVDMVFLRGRLYLMSPVGPVRFENHPISDEGDGEARVMLRFRADESDQEWPATRALEGLREAQDDALIARWDLGGVLDTPWTHGYGPPALARGVAQSGSAHGSGP